MFNALVRFEVDLLIELDAHNFTDAAEEADEMTRMKWAGLICSKKSKIGEIHMYQLRGVIRAAEKRIQE